MSRMQKMLAEGLSPRVRGNPFCTVSSVVARWSIPACAGEPLRRSRRCRWGGVYPRVCGGTPLPVDARHEYHGLSPRVRGNPCEGLITPMPDGSIPACAGEPLG